MNGIHACSAVTPSRYDIRHRDMLPTMTDAASQMMTTCRLRLNRSLVTSFDHEHAIGRTRVSCNERISSVTQRGRSFHREWSKTRESLWKLLADTMRFCTVLDQSRRDDEISNVVSLASGTHSHTHTQKRKQTAPTNQRISDVPFSSSTQSGNEHGACV